MFSRFLRYCIAGLLITVTYVLFTAVAVETMHVPPLVCSWIGFVLALPVAYLGHRNFTFQSTGRHVVELPRFIVSTLTMFIVSSASIVLIVDVFGKHYFQSLLVTSLLAPIVNFITMQLWVFRGGRT